MHLEAGVAQDFGDGRGVPHWVREVPETLRLVVGLARRARARGNLGVGLIDVVADHEGDALRPTLCRLWGRRLGHGNGE